MLCCVDWWLVIPAPMKLRPYGAIQICLLLLLLLLLSFFWPSVDIFPREFTNWDIQNWVQIYQSVLSGVGKLSCNKTWCYYYYSAVNDVCVGYHWQTLCLLICSHPLWLLTTAAALQHTGTWIPLWLHACQPTHWMPMARSVLLCSATNIQSFKAAVVTRKIS